MQNLKPLILGCLFIPAAAIAAPAFTSELQGFVPEYQTTLLDPTVEFNDYVAQSEPERVVALGKDVVPMAADLATPKELLVDTLLTRARSQLNSLYHFGGTSPKQGFDCSGFVGWIYRDVLRTELPRVADAMYKIDAPRVSAAKLSPGDLMFYRISGGRVSHVTMYVGGRNFIHATRPGQRLRIESMDMPYWRQRFAGAKRILGTPLLKAQFQANN